MTDIRELLAANIKNYRRIQGITQEILAERAGTSTTHIGMIEIGKKFPSTAMLTRIAEALGVDTPELFTREKIQMIQAGSISVEKFYQDILKDFEKIIAARIAALKQKSQIHPPSGVSVK
ncbi:MAG: helix-turn-helix transcriptional regulator [Treponema sp.]|jgi:transcriptional regulator with XRE-family HTH domain|nr:helix-turn-helix transcriptional regulator [Treponema sp.]